MVTRASDKSARTRVGRRCHNELMKRKNALVLGFAAGYVLGAKAGRERYEQILKVARGISSNPAIRQVIDETKDLADAGGAKARGKMADQLRDASALIKDRVN